MCGYFTQTIQNYAHIAAPMVSLTKKKNPWSWGDPEIQSFVKLKAALLGNKIMAYPQTDKPYKLFTDACDYATGALLVQEDASGADRVIQYISHQLSGAQLRWSTIEKEAFAVVYALQKLRPYLQGAVFTIYTDHKPLQSFFSAPMKNPKLQRWAMIVSEMGGQIRYFPGKDNECADMLS